MTVRSWNLPVVERWWRSESASPHVTRLWEPHVTPLLRCNVWHVRGRDRDLVVDSGLGVAPLRQAFPSLFQREPIVVVTHSHYDHVGGLHEFTDRRGHRLESEPIAAPRIAVGAALLASGIDADELAHLLDVGYDVPPLLLDAVPAPGFDLNAFQVRPAPLGEMLDEGDRIDLGDRVLTVLHLPGHTPGSIGLLDEATGELFSGDAVYDGPLLDELEESDIPAYRRTMDRLRELPVSTVYPGHEEIFGRDRLVELTTTYLRSRCVRPETAVPAPSSPEGATPDA